MNDNFKIRMVENDIDTHGRWLIHIGNIDKWHKTFYHLKNINQFNSNNPPKDVLGLFEVDKTHSCSIYQHDVIRCLTISEYITLGCGLKALNRRNNKKQDKLI